MRQVLVSLLVAGVAGGSLGCGAAASGVGRAAVGAGARTGARAATVSVPKVVVPTVPRVVTPAAGAAKAGGRATEHSGGFGEHLMQEVGQQAVTRALRGSDDDRKTR